MQYIFDVRKESSSYNAETDEITIKHVRELEETLSHEHLHRCLHREIIGFTSWYLDYFTLKFQPMPPHCNEVPCEERTGLGCLACDQFWEETQYYFELSEMWRPGFYPPNIINLGGVGGFKDAIYMIDHAILHRVVFKLENRRTSEALDRVLNFVLARLTR